MANEIRTGIRLDGDASGMKAAFVEGEKAVEQLKNRVNETGMSAKQTAAAMRMLPAQITDIVTGIASGQAPMTVLIQQGGQLKDMFGGAGAAARVLGSYVLGMVNPLSIAAVAGAGAAYAFLRGREEATRYQTALVMTGNAVGTTADQMQGMAARIDGVVGTQARAAEVLTMFAETAAVGGQNLERFTATAMRFEQVTGRAVEETVTEFEQLAKSPLEATVKLNEKYNYLTESVYRQIKALQDAGRETDAARVAQEAFASSLETRTAQIEGNLGLIERGWRAIKGAVKEAGDAMLSIGREPTLQDRIKTLQENLAARQERNRSVGIKDGKATEDLRQEIAFLQEQERMLRRGAEQQAEQARQVKARVAFEQEGNKYLSEKEKLERALERARQQGRDAGASGKEIFDREKAIRDEFAKKGGKSDGGYERLSDQIGRRLALAKSELDADEKLSASERFRVDMLAQISQAEDKLGKAKADKLRALVDETTAQIQSNEAQAVAHRWALDQRELDARRADAAQKEAAGLVEGNKRLRDEVQEIGASREGLIALEKARISSAIATKEEALARFQGLESYTREEDAIRNQIAALRERLSLLDEKASRSAADESMKSWEKVRQQDKEENQRRAESLAESIGQGILDGTRRGSSIMDIWRRELKAQFARTVLQPMIAPVAKGMNDAISSVIGNAMNYFLGSGTADPDGSYTAVENARLQQRATGGAYGPGLVLRGENGPELSWENSGGYVFSANETRQILNGGSGGGANVSIQVINQGGAALQVTGQRQTTGADGALQVEVMVRQVEDALAGNVAAGSGSLARAMEGRYGLRTAVN